MSYRWPLLLALFFAPALFADASQSEVIFFEDFETDGFLDRWEIESTNTGRIRVIEDPRDPENHGLSMDDSTSNAVFSQNVARTVVPISGHSDIRIAVDLLSLNDEVHSEGGFDGVVLRVGDKISTHPINWDEEQLLSIELPAEMEARAAGGESLIVELHQFDNFSAPDDGLFFDNVVVTGIPSRAIYVEAPRQISELDPLTVTVLIDPIPEDDVTVSLRLSSGTIHGSAIYPANAAMAQLTFPNFENNRLDGDRFELLSISDGYFSSMPFYVLVEDATAAGLVLTLPETLPEGASGVGWLSVSVDRTSWITIHLESSDPSVLAVPEAVNLSPYSSAASFQWNSFVDPRVLEDREVTVTARVGGDIVTKTLIVTEQNTLSPAIDGPTELVEGENGTFTFTIDGVSDEELTISFGAAAGEISFVPETVTLEPGERTGSVTVSVADDALVQGNRPFKITATTNTGQRDEFEGMILDNDIAGFAFDLPESIQADAPQSLVIRAVNQTGSTVAAFEGLAKLFLQDADTGEETVLRDEIAFVGGAATVDLNLPFTSRGDLLVIRSHDDIEARSTPLVIFAKLLFAAVDLVYDPHREMLYTVSDGAAAAGYLHSVTPIDPETTEIGDPLFLGNSPRNVAITDDSQFLYVGLGSSYSVRRVNLESFTSGANIVLDADSAWSGDSFTPYGLLTLPGRPRDVIVSQDHTSSTYWTTRLYIDGQVQPANSRDAIQLVPASAPDEFYAFNSSDTGFDFMRLRLKHDGYETVESRGGIFSGFSTRIAGAQDLIFSNGGVVVDGLKMEIVANLRFPSNWSTSYGAPSMAMLADTERSRIYYAHGNEIAAFDTGVFRLAATTKIPGIGDIKRMVRWGDGGLALLTSAAELILLEDGHLVPSGPATDLSVTIAASPDPVYLSEELTYTASIENVSEVTARGTSLVIDLNEGQTLESVFSGDFDYRIEERTVVIEIGDLAPGERHEFEVKAVASALTTLVGSAAAVSRFPDLNFGDNKASTVLNVGFESAPNSLNVVKIPSNDVLVNPVNGDLVLSVAASAHEDIANRIMTINPRSGLIKRSIPLPAEPGKLALSDDGTTAYALNPTRNAALRVNLDTEEFVGSVAFGDLNVSDLKVLPGTVDSLIIGSGWDGVRVYDNGVVRPRNSGTYNGNLIVLLPDPNLVFGYNTEHTGFESFKFELDAGGVQTIAETGGLFSGFSMGIENDGYYVYGIYGKGVRADLMSIDGTFPLATAFSSSSSGTTAVEPERAAQRVYYSRHKQIASFDSETYLHIRTKAWSELPANIVSLERWGEDGFVARLQNNELAIIRTDLVPDAASPIDLLVSIPENFEVAVPSLTITGEAYSGQGISSVRVGEQPATSSSSYASWSATVDDLVPGENTLTITATAFGTPQVTRTITRTVRYFPERDTNGNLLADSWVYEQFGDADSPLADPFLDVDGDGQINLHEFLFGTDPLESDSPHFTITTSQEGEIFSILLEFTHRDSDTFSFAVESSADLKIWQTFNGTIERAGTPVEVAGRHRYLTTTYRLQPEEATRASFYRIRASQQ